MLGDLLPTDPRLKGVQPDVDLARFVRVLKSRAAKAASIRAIYDAAIIVAGSRTFNDYEIFSDVMRCWLDDHPKIARKPHVWLSGDAREGPDAMVQRWAEEYPVDRPMELFPACWKEYGKPAGYRRNAEMADCATHLIVFWDGKSRGTKHMHQIAKDKGLDTQLVLVNPDPGRE